MEEARFPGVITRGVVRGSRFNPVDVAAFRRVFDVPDETIMDVETRPVGILRSDEQNDWYWGGVITPIAREIGEDDLKVVHDDLRRRLFYTIERVEISEGRWAYVRRLRSTANLSRGEFWEWCEIVRRFAAVFLNLDIEDPRPYDQRRDPLHNKHPVRRHGKRT